MKLTLIPNFVGKRWLKISLRSLHLVGIAGVFASLFTATSFEHYWIIAITSGVALLLLDALSNLIWFVQVRALVMYLKLALFVALFYFPQFAGQFLIVMILLSGFIAHAPSSVRYYSFVHLRKITSLADIKG